MKLFWNIRCFNRQTNLFGVLSLYLDTTKLDLVQRHRIELCVEQGQQNSREFLKYRNIFVEVPPGATDWELGSTLCTVGVSDYLEDENGIEMSIGESISIQTGQSNIIVFPPQYRSHDIEFSITPNSPIPDKPLDVIKLTQDEVNSIALFVRDTKELVSNPLYSTHPVLHSDEKGVWTEVLSVDIIRSYVTVFRRLYMIKERGCYVNACNTYIERFWNKRLINWINAELTLYQDYLVTKASFFGSANGYSFTNKRLIDVFLYTKFAHQPSDERQKQYNACLAEVVNDAKLDWIFYTVILNIGTRFKNAVGYLEHELNGYLKIGGLQPTITVSPLINERGRGEQLTEEQKNASLLIKRAATLGKEQWVAAGSPPNEMPAFVEKATKLLLRQMSS